MIFSTCRKAFSIEISPKRAHLDKSSLLEDPPTVQWVGPVGFHLSLLGSRIHHGLYWVAFIYLKRYFAGNELFDERTWALPCTFDP